MAIGEANGALGVASGARHALGALIRLAVALFIAHELLHLWQADHGRPIDDSYLDIRLLDGRDANAYATRALRRYRTSALHQSR